MLRRFLACFALLTGLAAFGAPANAAVVEAMSCEIGASAAVADAGDEERPSCEDRGARRPSRNPDRPTVPGQRNRGVIKPPVLYGVDRALE